MTVLTDQPIPLPASSVYRTEPPVRPRARGFYESALRDGERSLYSAARGEGGLEGEIALLRLRLHLLLRGRIDAGTDKDTPEITSQVLRIVDLLVKAVRAHGVGAGGAAEQAALEAVLEEEAVHVLRNSGV